MKAFVTPIVAAAVAVAMTGCAEETAQPEPARVSFRIEDGSVPADLESNHSLVLSLETPTGDPVFALKNVSFQKDAGGYTTSALDVPAGDYVITEFMLIDDTDNIAYTIPDGDAPLKAMVSQPLGITMTVTPDRAAPVVAQALSTKGRKPGDFGLASFNTRNSFQVMATDGGKKPVAAKAYILSSSDTVATFNLPAKKSRIGFDGDPNATYRLVVSSPACAPGSMEFTLADWGKTYRSKPLKVELAPAFTAVARTGVYESNFYFYLGADNANITVDWGDGTVEEIVIDDLSGVEVAHNYNSVGTSNITITGDLDKIDYFYSFYGGSIFADVRLKHLTNLNEIRFGLTNGPAVLDLSHNENLEFAMLPGLLDLERLILPENHRMKFLEVDGDNRLDAGDINYIIENIHRNAVAGNIMDGVFGLRASWAQQPEDHTLIGPPSAESMNKLSDLETNLGWIIHPGKADEELYSNGRVRLSQMNM